MEIQFIQPGRTMQNGYIERLYRVYHEAILDAYLFTDIHEVRALTEEWIEEYKEQRPYEELQNHIPTKKKQQIKAKLNTLNLSGKGGTYTLILVCVMLQSDVTCNCLSKYSNVVICCAVEKKHRRLSEK
jgi:hypothetical protein